MKIFLLIDSTFSKRDFDRFGIDILINKKVEIIIWDFRKLRSNKVSSSNYESDFFHDKLNYNLFNNFNEIDAQRKQFFNCFLIDQRSDFYKKYDTCWFYENGAITIKLEQGLLPISVWKPSLYDSAIIFKNYFIYNGLVSLLNKILKFSINLISNKKNKSCYNIKVCSGSSSRCTHGEFEIRSHALDYDIFLKYNLKNIKSKNNIVFLDNGMTDHPDYKKLSIEPYCTSENYFPLLRSFFDKIEDKLSSRVVVAAHPRVVIDDSMIDDFGGREVIAGKTAELVRDAKMVVAHDTTSINFVALWRVPLIIITTNQIEKRIYTSMEAVVSILNTTRLNIDKQYDNIDFNELSKKPIYHYNEYVEKLIKEDNSNTKHSAEILYNRLKKYHV